MKVYINILNYNSYEKSCVCIESCMKQSGIDFEILLIDNASTDDSFFRLKRRYDGRIKFLQTGKNYGYAGGNNRGVKYCFDNGCQYALLLNSDTELIGVNLLSKLVSVIKEHGDCAVVSPTIYDITKFGNIKHTNDYLYNKLLRLIGVLPPIRNISDTLRITSEAHGSALLVDCKCFLKNGGFPEHYFMYCEESTFAKKIQWDGRKIYWYVDMNNCVYHHHDKSECISPWREFLIGRNRAIEYYENKKYQSKLWGVIYMVYQIKMRYKFFRSQHKHYYLGMKEGKALFNKKESHENLYLNGLKISQTYK